MTPIIMIVIVIKARVSYFTQIIFNIYLYDIITYFDIIK